MTVTCEADANARTDRPGGHGAEPLVTKWFPVVAAVEEDGVTATPAAGGGRSLTLVASTGAEDRAGDIVDAAGWELEAYRANPVFLWAHDYRRPAIGRSLRTWVHDGPDGGRLMAEIEFAPTVFAQEVGSLYAAGFMRGISVGFRALEVEPRAAAGGRRGLLFKRQELLEISAAPVPVNPGALARGARAAPGPEPAGPGRAALEEVKRFWTVLAGVAGREGEVAGGD